MKYMLALFVAILLLGCNPAELGLKPLSIFEVGLPNNQKRWITAENYMHSGTRCTFWAKGETVASFDCSYVIQTPYAHNLKLP